MIIVNGRALKGHSNKVQESRPTSKTNPLLNSLIQARHHVLVMKKRVGNGQAFLDFAK
jgi:hypothetical protein